MDCRWFDINSQTIMGEVDMYTGVNNQEDCNRGKVGIGINHLHKAKLDVESILERDKSFVGIYGNTVGSMFDNTGYFIGVQGNAESDGYPGSVYVNVGVRGEGRESQYVIGVDGVGIGYPGTPLNTAKAMGVRGVAFGAEKNFSIYGELPIGEVGWAGYFCGPFVQSNFSIYMSDGSVKNDIQDLTNATEILSALQPKTYFYQSPENRPINFEEEMQYGFIAQEVQEVIPTIVKTTQTPELLDSLGVVEGTAVDLLGIQYDAIIPILVAGFKEQNMIVSDQAAQLETQNETIATLEAQAEQLEQMQNDMQAVLAAVQTMQQKIEVADQRVNTCCTPKTGGGETGALLNENHKELELKQNVPNPFDDQTRITFKLPNAADVILEITDAAGRPLERLIDGKMSSGEHTTLWAGSTVASGIYFYTLYADGQLITKKMIKR